MSDRTCDVDGCDKRHYCKGWCKTHYNRSLASDRKSEAAQCKTCEHTFHRTDRKQVYCSTDCREITRRHLISVSIGGTGIPISRSAERALRRAPSLTQVDNTITLIDLGDRDQWRCGICMHRVDRMIKYPDPTSPSIDHVIGLAVGGQHVWENVQLAHLDCNRRKR